MKNKIYKYLFIVVINFLNLQTAISEEIEFKSKNIEIRNDGNLFIGNGNVEVITEKNLLIYSDKAEFNKADEKVYLFENTKIFQTNQNIVITGNKFVYDKKLEILYSLDETIIEINNRYLIKTSNIEYFILDSLIRSPDHTTVTDNVSNKFEASSFNINLDTKILKSPKIKLTDSNQNILKAKQNKKYTITAPPFTVKWSPP